MKQCKNKNGIESKGEWSILERAYFCNEGSKSCRPYQEEKIDIIRFSVLK